MPHDTADAPETTRGSASPGYLVPAVRNAVAIINYLNGAPSHAVTLAELSTKLALTKSHCHSILRTLVQAGWVTFDERTKSYELSSGLISSASSLLNSPVLDRIRERLAALTSETGYSGMLTQPQADGTFVVVDYFSSRRAVEFRYSVGFRFPADSPAQSRAFIAWQPAERIEAWLDSLHPHRYTPASKVDREQLAEEVRATRQRGYSRSVAEHFDGMMACAMPIYDSGGRMLYIFCIIGRVQDLQVQEEVVAVAMKRTVEDIHRAILARPPIQPVPQW